MLQRNRSVPATIVLTSAAVLLAFAAYSSLRTASAVGCEGFHQCIQYDYLDATPSPTPTPTIIDVSPQPLITDQEEFNWTNLPDAVYGGKDVDCDCIENGEDNCPFVYNPDQEDSDKNGIGDACDGKNKGKIESHCDADGDGIPSYRDNCRLVCNPDQTDKSNNGIGDACDPEILTNWKRIDFCAKPAPKNRCGAPVKPRRTTRKTKKNGIEGQ